MPRPMPAPRGKLGPFLMKRVKEQNISMQELADACDRSLNHTRAVLLGDSCPSDEMLDIIASKLKVKFQDLVNLRSEDQVMMHDRHGKNLAAVKLNIPKSLMEIVPTWVTLSPTQQRLAAEMIQTIANQGGLPGRKHA